MHLPGRHTRDTGGGFRGQEQGRGREDKQADKEYQDHAEGSQGRVEDDRRCHRHRLQGSDVRFSGREGCHLGHRLASSGECHTLGDVDSRHRRPLQSEDNLPEFVEGEFWDHDNDNRREVCKSSEGQQGLLRGQGGGGNIREFQGA